MVVETGAQLLEFFKGTRQRTEAICAPLEIEDYVVQPIEDVSPPKWHLGHTTWFFEHFILIPHLDNYQVFDTEYAYVFNSYYEAAGKRVLRTNRGNLSRPSVRNIYKYRLHVTDAMCKLLDQELTSELSALITIGCHHEQQHQELLLTDVKYILGHNPLFPIYGAIKEHKSFDNELDFNVVEEGLYTVGYQDAGFCYDNELGVHQQYLESYKIANRLITNREYLEFIEDGAYQAHSLWHAEAWQWIQSQNIQYPLYWHFYQDKMQHYTLAGLKDLSLDDAVSHISFYEAWAYAEWAGYRLATEAEWETAARTITNWDWGHRWEWTESAYLPYPRYQKAAGALGEYNGKFMVNQKVLRGSSIATARHHSRVSYRNFFHPHLRWQYTGIRLAQTL